MRSGFSLPELLIVLAILGIIAAMGLPRTRGLLDDIAAETGAREIMAAHIRARMIAGATGRVVLLDLNPDTLRIRTVLGTDTTLAWQSAGPRASGLTLAGPAHPLVYSPLGITMGASNGTWHLAFHSAVRDVIVSRLGRMRIR